MMSAKTVQITFSLVSSLAEELLKRLSALPAARQDLLVPALMRGEGLFTVVRDDISGRGLVAYDTVFRVDPSARLLELLPSLFAEEGTASAPPPTEDAA